MSGDLRPLAIVAAVSDNGVIGRDGRLPWHIPEDLAYFKQSTMGHAVLMGRRTYESVGRPLPGRRNIVISRRPGLVIPGCDVASSVADAIALARAGGDDEPRVVGGAGIYEEALPLATRLILTEVHRVVEGDTRFPPFDRDEWREVDRLEAQGVSFTVLIRR